MDEKRSSLKRVCVGGHEFDPVMKGGRTQKVSDKQITHFVVLPVIDYLSSIHYTGYLPRSKIDFSISKALKVIFFEIFFYLRS